MRRGDKWHTIPFYNHEKPRHCEVAGFPEATAVQGQGSSEEWSAEAPAEQDCCLCP